MRAVLKYDRDGRLVQEYKSIADAGRDNFIDVDQIWKALSGRAKTASGFIWRYSNGKAGEKAPG